MDFYRAYKNLDNSEVKLSKYEIYLANSVFSVIYDIDNSPYMDNYNDYIKSLFNLSGKPNSDLFFYSSERLNKVLEKYPEDTVKILKSYYGLDDGVKKTYVEVAKQFNLSPSAIVNKIYFFNVRLNNYSDRKGIIGNLEEIINKMDLDSSEKNKVYKADKSLRLSGKSCNRKDYLDLINKTVLNEDNSIKNKIDMNADIELLKKIDVRYFDVSTKVRNALYRANYNTLNDILVSDIDSLLKVRNLGEAGVNEVLDFVHSLGFRLIDEEKNKDDEKYSDFKEMDIHEIKISYLPLTTRTKNVLKKSGIKTLSDLLSYSTVSINSINNLGDKGVIEVLEFIMKNGYKLADQVAIETTNKEMLTDMKIRDLPFSSRTRNALLYAKIETFNDIISKSKSDLSKIRGLGKKGIEEIEDFVHSKGFKFINEDLYKKISKTNENTNSNLPNINKKDLDSLKKVKKESEDRIKEKEEKSRLLDEYIELLDEQEKLKKLEADLDKRIKEKEAKLNSLKLKKEKKTDE